MASMVHGRTFMITNCGPVEQQQQQDGDMVKGEEEGPTKSAQECDAPLTSECCAIQTTVARYTKQQCLFVSKVVYLIVHCLSAPAWWQFEAGEKKNEGNHAFIRFVSFPLLSLLPLLLAVPLPPPRDLQAPVCTDHHMRSPPLCLGSTRAEWCELR